MKKIFMLMLFSAIMMAGEFKWAENFDEAKKTAAETDKIVMIMFSQEGCKTCEYMEFNAFVNEELQNYIYYFFVPVKIDIYKDTVPKGFRPRGTPTFYFTDKDGKKLARKIVGGARPDHFLSTLKDIRQKALR